eukprot:6482465-Amphidinium_carterae.3
MDEDDEETRSAEMSQFQKGVRLVDALAMKLSSSSAENLFSLAPSRSAAVKFSDLQVYYFHRLGRKSRDRHDLKDTMDLAFEAMFSDVLGDLQALQPPARSTMHKYHFLVDAAMLLQQHEINSCQEVLYRFGWADSSPILNRDWLMVKSVVIKGSVAHKVWRSACHLEEVCAHLADDHIENVAALHSCRTQHDCIKAGVVYHVSVPTSLELAHADLSHKLAGFVWAHALECSSRADLQRVLGTYRSLTTDLGTESGLATVRARMDDIVPPWWHPTQQPGTLADGAESDVELEPEVSSLMPQCMPIPGMLHVLNNMEMDIDNKTLAYFDTWYPAMKNFAQLLTDASRVRLLWSSCLEGTRYANKPCMKNFHALPKPYEKRWSHVHLFLSAAWEVLLNLRQAWSEIKYVQALGSERNKTEFSPTLMTATLQDC